MIALITRYILFIQLIFNLFTTFSISVKTYQVRRINESTYLVTSFPEMDNDSHKRFSDNKTPNKVVPLNDDKKFTDYYETTMSTVTVGEKKDKAKKVITPELIKKARENYFRTYYATMKKSNYSFSLLPDKVNPYLNLVDINNETTVLTVKFKQNLVTARKLATLLINEAQLQTDLKAKEKYLDDINRRRRNLIKKPRHKIIWEDWSWKRRSLLFKNHTFSPE